MFSILEVDYNKEDIIPVRITEDILPGGIPMEDTMHILEQSEMTTTAPRGTIMVKKLIVIRELSWSVIN